MQRYLIRRWLLAIEMWANHRIEAGDLDFDNTVYRTREAAGTLLAIHFPEGRTD